MSEQESSKSLPVLPIKNSVLFPYLLMPLAVGRPRSVAAVEEALSSEEKEIVVVAQRDATVDFPAWKDLHTIGTKAVIRKMARGGEGRIEMIVQGMERVALIKLEQTEPYLKALVKPAPLPADSSTQVEALHREVIDLMNRIFSLARPEGSLELTQLAGNVQDPQRMVYFLAPMLSFELEKEQALLEAPAIEAALRLMHEYLTHEAQVLELRKEISSQAQVEMGKEQREYLLRKQMRAIQQELGEQNPEQAEANLLKERLAKAELPAEARKEAERELSKLERLPTAAPEYNVIRTYLDFVLELPWRKSSDPFLDLAYTRQVLDEDHFDLKEVKERILEQLGVLKLNPQAKAPILCFVGPPGVGKTSLGQSIARSLKRKFERMSLGGLHDEAELRGHRRTYIGAMPGRIIQAIRRAGVNNPVLMLDEVDKLGRDFRGDPAAALLEVLDPEQNKEFHDNYLDLAFDLSNVFFITTANAHDTVPRPLLDRMEILRLPGYSDEEKQEIARRYLIPRRLKESGLTAEQCALPDQTLAWIISRYTREAGLRQLERAIGRLARKVALRFAEGKAEPATLKPEDLPDLLGPEPFFLEQARKQLPSGVATGLAWTEAGGDVLFIEATLLPEGRGMTLTGQLGEVMQESAKAAQSYVWAHAEELGIDHNLFRKSGVHIHVPAGAIPKDGPSAGITMAAALASVYTRCPVRSDTAMTGEMTLTGLVMPVGGIKEKVLAARRAGIQQVILSAENRKDLRELPDHVQKEMAFIFVERIEEVFQAAIPGLSERLPLAKAGA
ncbi:MAG: endopeptidase La [Planctomycetes bacterium]|nr:endopeptidase La [Planctomycetota bacterium]